MQVKVERAGGATRENEKESQGVRMRLRGQQTWGWEPGPCLAQMEVSFLCNKSEASNTDLPGSWAHITDQAQVLSVLLLCPPQAVPSSAWSKLVRVQPREVRKRGLGSSFLVIRWESHVLWAHLAHLPCPHDRPWQVTSPSPSLSSCIS